MKKTNLSIRLLILSLALLMALSLVSCKTPMETPKTNEGTVGTTAEEKKEAVSPEGIWKDATYLTPQTLGEGKLQFDLKVIAEGESLIFTIKTEEENLGKALLGAKIVEGEEGAYGLYIKKVNGMTADYDVNQTYWSFCIDGEMQMTGVSDVTVSGGEEFELVLAK